MKTKFIESLADILNEKGLTAVEVWEGETKIRLEKNLYVRAETASAPFVHETTASCERKVTSTDSYTEIKSPMVGVFYTSPTPDAKPFVNVGDNVKKGDVLCIIEAMKLMNEITSECDGEIAEVCVGNGDVVEYSQVLFKLK